MPHVPGAERNAAVRILAVTVIRLELGQPVGRDLLDHANRLGVPSLVTTRKGRWVAGGLSRFDQRLSLGDEGRNVSSYLIRRGHALAFLKPPNTHIEPR